MDQRFDAGRSQMRLHVVARRAAHREKVIHVAGVELRGNRDRVDSAQLLAIAAGERATAFGPPAEQRQTRPQHRRLHFIEARVDPELVVPVFVRLPAVAKPLRTRRDRRIARRQGAAVAESSEVLRGIEAVRRDGAVAADRTAIARRQVRLAAVLDDGEVVPSRDVARAAHVGGLAVEVNGHDCGGPGRHGRCRGAWIERETLRIDVGKYRPRAGHHDGQRRVCRRKGRRDDLIARPDPERSQADRQRVGPGADAGRVRRLTRGRELVFERFQLGTENEPPARHDPRDAPPARRPHRRPESAAGI